MVQKTELIDTHTDIKSNTTHQNYQMWNTFRLCWAHKLLASLDYGYAPKSAPSHRGKGPHLVAWANPSPKWENNRFSRIFVGFTRVLFVAKRHIDQWPLHISNSTSHSYALHALRPKNWTKAIIATKLWLNYRVVGARAFQFGQKKFRFDSILAAESIFRFDSIRQSDKIAASTLIFK